MKNFGGGPEKDFVPTRSALRKRGVIVENGVICVADRREAIRLAMPEILELYREILKK